MPSRPNAFIRVKGGDLNELYCYFTILPTNFEQFTIELANKGITDLFRVNSKSRHEQLDDPFAQQQQEYFRI